jgi:HSP20 family molecular chaperone IbpA
MVRYTTHYACPSAEESFLTDLVIPLIACDNKRYLAKNKQAVANTDKKATSCSIPVDVYETEEKVVIMAGLFNVASKEDIKLIVGDDNQVLIQAKVIEFDKDARECNYHIKELSSFNEYSRRIALPCEVKVQKAEATFEKNVLRITFPKVMPEEKITQIKIH